MHILNYFYQIVNYIFLEFFISPLENIFNATYLKNELKNLGNDTGYMDLDGIQGFSGGGTRGSNGQPFPYFYGYKTDGVFQNMDEVRAYVNKDGKMMRFLVIHVLWM